jgi:HemY protein
MIKVLLFIAAAVALAVGAVWLAERPGEVALVWQGQEIRTSLMVAASALFALIVVGVIIWSLLRFVFNIPDAIGLFMRARRRTKGFEAISRGIVAVGSGDTRAARRFAGDAARLAGDEPLTLLLKAQTAQLVEDRPAAESAFRDMTEHNETKLLGLRGLHLEALRRGDALAARAHVEEAVKIAPGVAWAGQALMEFQCLAGEWRAALTTLERNIRAGSAPKEQAQRQRAVLMTAEGLTLADTRRDEALKLAQDALKADVSLVPAAVLAGRLLAERGDIKRASRVLEATWRIAPHPELAEAYAHVRMGDSARDRLARIVSLTQTHSTHRESALALANAAVEATEFDRARKALVPHLDHPTQRVCLMMAKIEAQADGDLGRAREWIGRAVRAERDPAWVADGLVSDVWRPLSPVTRKLDGYVWQTPGAPAPGTTPLLDDVVMPEPALPEPVLAPAPIDVTPKPEPAKAPTPEAPTILADPARPAEVAAASPRLVPKVAEVKPLESRPVESKPVENKPAERAPLEMQPVEVKTAEVKAAEIKAAEAKPAEPKPTEAKLREPAPVIALMPPPDDPGPEAEPDPDLRPRRRFGPIA